MKKNLTIILIFIVILVVGLGIGWFLGRGGYDGNEKTAQFNEGSDDIFQGAARQDEVLERGGFSVLIPMGWKEVAAPTGVSAMVVNAGEEVSDPALQNINFRSYYSVSYDTLKEKTIEEYSAYIKNMVKEFAPNIVFTPEENIKINANDAYKLEADLNQQGANFKVLIFLIKGKDDDIWNMSFNSGAMDWEKNREEFDRIAQTFTIK
ncbi:MAG: hypothetical protein WC582_02025 [Patescibacteria group bacterium]